MMYIKKRANPKSLLTLLFVIFGLISCKNDEDNIGIQQDSYYTSYLADPNSQGQLLSEIYIEEDKSTTYVYGTTDQNGNPYLFESLAYKSSSSEKTFYVLFDEFHRVTHLYSEENGVKDAELHLFTYPEPGIVNYIVLERDWSTLEDQVLHFSTVETDGENFNSSTLFTNAKSITEFNPDVLIGPIGVALGVAGAAVTLFIAPTVFAGVAAAVVFAAAATASEPTISPINPNVPASPPNTLAASQCENSNMEVIIGVDPGNVLVAIVNGNSQSYRFYWSTGEVGTGLMSHSITAPDSGTYYVMVVDDNGCIAFGSTNPDPDLLGCWTLTRSVNTSLSTEVCNNNNRYWLLGPNNLVYAVLDDCLINGWPPTYVTQHTYLLNGTNFSIYVYFDNGIVQESYSYVGIYDNSSGQEVIRGNYSVNVSKPAGGKNCIGTFVMVRRP